MEEILSPMDGTTQTVHDVESTNADDSDTFVVFALIICFAVILFVAFRFGRMIERLVGSGSSSLIPPLQTLPAQPIGKVYNPFAVNLIDSRLASMTNGVHVSITARRPCWLGIYWGTVIADMYPVIHRPWLEMRDITSSSALMSSISLHHEDLQIHETSVNKDLLLHPPSTLELGRPPRNRYPLVLLIIDSEACAMSTAELDSCQHIVMVTALVHLKDEHCTAESHIFSQLVRTPHHKPHDMKNLYVSRDSEVPSTPDIGEDAQTASDLGLCVVCQSSAVERALLPCRHTCVCNGCFAVLLHCPLCRTFITSSFDVASSSARVS